MKKTVLVTGGARGIGKAIVYELIRNGAKVVFTYLKSDDAAKVVLDKIKGLNGEGVSIRSDSKDFDQAKKVIEETVNRFARLDILVNCAGIIKDKALMLMVLATLLTAVAVIIAKWLYGKLGFWEVQLLVGIGGGLTGLIILTVRKAARKELRSLKRANYGLFGLREVAVTSGFLLYNLAIKTGSASLSVALSNLNALYMFVMATVISTDPNRARAAMEGRDYVIPDDVKFIAREVLVHRLLLKADMWAIGMTVKNVVENIVDNVPVPKVD